MTEPPPAPSESTDPSARGLLPTALISRDLQQRLIFYGLWGALMLGILVVFREVLLPFFLAVVVAYVMSPLVDWLQRWMARWVAVVTIYALLVGTMVTFTVLGVPRLAAEIEKLAKDAPSALAELRDEWLPAIERRMRDSMGQAPTAAPPGDDTIAVPAEPGEPITSITPSGVPEAPAGSEERGPGVEADADQAPMALGTAPEDATASAQPDEPITVRRVRGGGYDIHLPSDGLVVTPEGDGYIVRTAHQERTDGDLAAAFVESVRGVTRNTQDTATTLLHTAQTVVRAVVKGVFTFFIMLMLSAYLLVTKDEVIGFFRNFARPEKRATFDSLLSRIDRGLSGVVRGQLLICLINGALSGVGFYILDLAYWPILTLIATLFSIIPIFGAILSSVPAVVLGLKHGVGTAALVVLWIVVIHQIEANLLNPKIMGDAAHVHPVLVVFALLGGEHLFGIAGALLAVPVLSILQSLFLHYREQVLGVPAPKRADTSSISQS
ncbi:MAG: AI-2E family transporter [Polyangiales bacterium]|nr:AI-2E family transporter [Myxococcales bacterium]MCB9658953.1 AI-2E family transporter [Sandaracinaceae bacterium]